MTAQSEGANYVMKAYVFVMDYGRGHTDVACIAGTIDEAQAKIESRYTDRDPKCTFFNTGVAAMQPAIIEWREDCKRVTEKGYYAFFQGMFFCKCGDYQKVAHCKKEKSWTGWIAYIYGDNHHIKPI